MSTMSIRALGAEVGGVAFVQFFLMIQTILILNQLVNTQPITSPGSCPRHSDRWSCNVREGTLLESFLTISAISRSDDRTCAKCFEWTHLNHVETVERERGRNYMGLHLNKDGGWKKMGGCWYERMKKRNVLQLLKELYQRNLCMYECMY